VAQRGVLLYSQTLPLSEKTISLEAHVAGIHSNLHIPPALMNQENRFYFLSKTFYSPNRSFNHHHLLHIQATARKHCLQIFVCLVKYLLIFFCVLTSQKIEGSFFVVKLLSYCGMHQMKKTMNLKQNYHHNLVAQ